MNMTDELLLTFSASDKTLKIWRLNEEGCDCLKTEVLSTTLAHVHVDRDSGYVAIVNGKSKLAIHKFNESCKSVSDEIFEEEDDLIDAVEDLDPEQFEMASMQES